MSLFQEWVQYETRRQFFGRGANAVGMAALASLAELGGGRGTSARPASIEKEAATQAVLTHFAPKAKHVIYLHMVGVLRSSTSTTTSR